VAVAIPVVKYLRSEGNLLRSGTSLSSGRKERIPPPHSELSTRHIIFVFHLFTVKRICNTVSTKESALTVNFPRFCLVYFVVWMPNAKRLHAILADHSTTSRVCQPRSSHGSHVHLHIYIFRRYVY